MKDHELIIVRLPLNTTGSIQEYKDNYGIKYHEEIIFTGTETECMFQKLLLLKKDNTLPDDEVPKP